MDSPRTSADVLVESSSERSSDAPASHLTSNKRTAPLNASYHHESRPVPAGPYSSTFYEGQWEIYRWLDGLYALHVDNSPGQSRLDELSRRVAEIDQALHRRVNRTNTAPQVPASPAAEQQERGVKGGATQQQRSEHCYHHYHTTGMAPSEQPNNCGSKLSATNEAAQAYGQSSSSPTNQLLARARPTQIPTINNPAAGPETAKAKSTM